MLISSLAESSTTTRALAIESVHECVERRRLRSINVGGVDITNPAVGDLAVEGMKFISASESPNGVPLLVTANEVSGTTTVFQIVNLGSALAAADSLAALAIHTVRSGNSDSGEPDSKRDSAAEAVVDAVVTQQELLDIPVETPQLFSSSTRDASVRPTGKNAEDVDTSFIELFGVDD